MLHQFIRLLSLSFFLAADGDPPATPPPAVVPPVVPPATPPPEKTEAEKAQATAAYWERQAKAKDTGIAELLKLTGAKDLGEYTKAIQATADAAKSDLQKAQDEAATAKAEAASLKLQVQRTALADELELPANLRKYVAGDTEDAIKASIEQVKKDFPAAATPGATGGPPGSPKATATELQQLETQYAEAKKAGDTLVMLELTTKLTQARAAKAT